MKNENLLFAMDGIGDDLIAEALTPSSKRPRRSWLGWVAAAACLCLLLATPVGAVMAESLYKFLNANGIWEHSTLERLSLEALSPQALADFPDTAGATKYLEKDSLSDAEEYLGISLPDNPFLEAAALDELHIETTDGQRMDAHCIVRLFTGETAQASCVDTEAAYRVDGMPVYAMYRCPTEQNPYDNGGGVGIDPAGYETEDYTTPGGRTWDLYIPESDGSAGCVHALGNVDGMLTWIQIMTASELHEDADREVLTQILDAYDPQR